MYAIWCNMCSCQIRFWIIWHSCSRHWIVLLPSFMFRLTLRRAGNIVTLFVRDIDALFQIPELCFPSTFETKIRGPGIAFYLSYLNTRTIHVQLNESNYSKSHKLPTYIDLLGSRNKATMWWKFKDGLIFLESSNLILLKPCMDGWVFRIQQRWFDPLVISSQ